MGEAKSPVPVSPRFPPQRVLEQDDSFGRGLDLVSTTHTLHSSFALLSLYSRGSLALPVPFAMSGTCSPAQQNTQKKRKRAPKA